MNAPGRLPGQPQTGGLHAVHLAAVVVAGGELLIVRRRSGLWELPGGSLPVGLSIPDAIRRLVEADTGALVAVHGVTGIYPRLTPRVTITCRASQVGGSAPAGAARWIDVAAADQFLPGAAVSQVADALLPQKMWPELASPVQANNGAAASRP